MLWTNLVEGVELRSRSRCVRVLCEDSFRRSCLVDDQDRNRSKLDLINSTVSGRPDSVLFRHVFVPKLQQVSQDGQSDWSSELGNSRTPADALVRQERDKQR